MTHKQLQKWIVSRKGDLSWRKFATALSVPFSDLHRAARFDRVPKIGVLEALGVEKVVETRYRVKGGK